MSDTSVAITLTVNGEPVSERVDARKTLVDFLREDLNLTGSHVGCEHGVCGACTVRVDGAIVGEIADLQAAFATRNALQCGYCTPGMLVAAEDLLKRGGVPTREAIREHLSGNYCRCTGYHAIVDAVETVAMARTGGGK
jgi:carbon-monoxide dehydrogenase small subunit